jgi:hypothetical protein
MTYVAVNIPKRLVAGCDVSDTGHRSRLNLRAGELVKVKSETEILSTLDHEGKLESLPFMPEMLKHCGGTYRVFKRADKTCDTIQSSGLRRMHDTVLLEGLRCGGEAHDGCQAGCLFFWKEDWLKRGGTEDNAAASTRAAPEPPHPVEAEKTDGLRLTVHALMTATRSVNETGERVFSCQATELRNATTNLAWWHARQYIRDIGSGNVTLGQVVTGTVIGVFNKTQAVLRRFLPRRVLLQGGLKYPFIEGRLKRTPNEVLNLQPGELVQIKTKEEIVATLDTKNCNRGLLFEREMSKYCGRRARVLRRVDRFIDDRTGKMLQLDSDCFILENVYCLGAFNQFCPRGIYSFWREIWLNKVE